MATITTRSGKGSPLTNTEVDNNFTNLNSDKIENVVEDTTPQLGGDLDTNGNDISFGDNDKAVFGDGNDLEIYHDSANSYIVDSGTGTLNLRSSDTIRLQTSDGSGGWQNVFAGVDEGAAFLYYDGGDRLQTTSTGVYANLSLSIRSSSSPSGYNLHVSQDDSDKALAKFTNTTTGTTATDGFDVGINATEEAIVWHHENKPIRFGTNSTDRLLIENDGDISFYDTSGNAKFFWDASAESLGIGTTSGFGGKLDITLDTNARGYFSSSVGEVGSGNFALQVIDSTGASLKPLGFRAEDIRFATGASERMRLDSSGRLGIATTSPTTELDVSGTVTQDANLLRAIDTTIADTAVDVFVYDTRKDSDGGAWRKRTQHTSWYNETLNTSTRGSRKEFPAVAVIVAESNQVTIYDGDDPDMPMWMVFNQNSASTAYNDWFLGRSSIGDMTSAVMLNGKLVVSQAYTSSFAEAYNEIDFIKEVFLRRDTTVTNVFNNGEIVNRNGQAGGYYGVSGGGIVNVVAVNDVAMTVLPNAPIDSATGLPVPTIAVATNGGVSVIKDDGTVVDSNNTATMESIAISGDSLFIGETLYQDELFIVNNYAWLHEGFSQTNYYSQGFPAISTSSGNDVINDVAGISDVDVAIGMTATLTLLQQDKDTKGNGMVAYATSDYNTGWMNGDIKLATLSDTDTTNVTGSELVSAYGFAVDPFSNGWTDASIGTGTATYDATNDNIEFTRIDGSNLGFARTEITTVVGKTYVFSADVGVDGSVGLALNIGTSAGGNEIANVAHGGKSVQTATFVATTTTTHIRIYAGATTSTYVTADNVSVRLAEEDRSVNNNGLQVYGTVVKSAVETGADLVAYSGWTSSRYLSQPYNTDFNFGTSDFAFIWWMDSPTSSQDNIVWGLGDYSANNGLGCLALNSGGSGNQLTLHLEGSNIDSSVTVTNHEEAGWICVAMVRRGGVLYGYRNGVLQDTATATQSFSLASETVQELTLGAGYSGGSIFSNGFNGGKLSLFRASSTAPSPEQIKKIYEDEKVLFQENAQATLYGSSDAVTALAYDDSTNLLHAGTSAGRSVFQGLRRVDNTTDAVGSAISASNGMVADD